MRIRIYNVTKFALACLLSLNVLFLNFALPVCTALEEDNCCMKSHESLIKSDVNDNSQNFEKPDCCEINSGASQVDLFSSNIFEHRQLLPFITFTLNNANDVFQTGIFST